MEPSADEALKRRDRVSLWAWADWALQRWDCVLMGPWAEPRGLRREGRPEEVETRELSRGG